MLVSGELKTVGKLRLIVTGTMEMQDPAITQNMLIALRKHNFSIIHRVTRTDKLNIFDVYMWNPCKFKLIKNYNPLTCC